MSLKSQLNLLIVSSPTYWSGIEAFYFDVAFSLRYDSNSAFVTILRRWWLWFENTYARLLDLNPDLRLLFQ